MGVDIGGGGEGGVAQPVLNLLHGDALAEQKRGTAVAQIVEPDGPQAVALEQQLEMVGDIGGPEQAPLLVHTDVSQVVGAIGVLIFRPAVGLLFLVGQKQLPHGGDQGQRAKAGLGFQLVLGVEPVDSGLLALGNLMVDGDRPPLKVDGAPADAQHLAAPQAVVGGKLNNHRQDRKSTRLNSSH